MNARRRAGAAGWLACLCLLACAAPAQALRFVPAEATLSPPEAARAQAVLDDAARRLPPRWTQALGTVRVEWRDDLPAGVEGRAFGTGAAHARILLRRSLLDAAQDDRAARAAILHELAHLYDRSAEGGLSRDPRLLALAGWEDAPLRPWRTRNAFTDRSPDRYELRDPVEYVAVNLEHFLLDADYACRRPAMDRYLAEKTGAMPAQADCDPALPFMQAAPDAATPLLALDPARVYAVDYLLAEGDAEPMSRWGHAMLRLVVCAPGHAPGPACRLDLAYHQVLSFRAFVDDVQVSSWRGLTGSYPSRLFLLPLSQVVDEYTKVELRGLRSIPLRLSPGDIATLLQRAALVHWSYDGRYRFVGNNCAVETARLLQDGVPRLSQLRLLSITPRGVLRRLERADLVDAVPADRAEAMRLGYYFEPMSARYQAMYEVARTSLHLPEGRFQDWFALPPRSRAAAFDRADLRAAAALLVLEEAALRRQELRARDTLKHRMPMAGRDAAKGLLQLEDTLTRPALLVPGEGYGIPQAGERDAVARDAASLAARWRRQRDALLAQARDWLPAPQREALDATEANVAALGARLRQLAAPPAR
ncbi:MAG: DUF7844 domain-containing protein [Luteimonas sp.]